MKMAEIKSKNQSELQALLDESRVKLQGMKFELAAGKIKNVRLIHQVKKDIARLETVLSQERKQEKHG